MRRIKKMKKTLVLVIAAVLAAVLCICASAAINSNHLIDEGFPRFNDKAETEWELFGWSVVDTKITAMGYKLDGGSVVWADEDVDVRDNAKNLDKCDCFEDLELDRAIIDMSLSNGLEEFYGYRIHLTLDSTDWAKGAHTLEIVVKYADGTEGNPFRDSLIEFTKTKDASSGESQTDDDEETEAPETETKPDSPKTADAAVVAVACVAAAAFAGIVVSKKIRK